MQHPDKETHEVRNTAEKEKLPKEQKVDVPHVLEEITIEELAVDGICGIY